jgi:hypothetical protein
VTRPLTPTQAGQLELFRKLPARYRRHQRAGGVIRIEVLDSYDARSWRGLFQRGLLRCVEDGFVVVEDAA